MKPLQFLSLALLVLAALIAQPFIVRAELPGFVTITGQVTNESGDPIAAPSVIAVAGDDTLGAYMSDSEGRFRIDLAYPAPTAVEEGAPESLPIDLYPNYPNPFNPSTTISFELAQPGNASLTVYSVTGQKVTTLFRGRASAGLHRVVWDGRDDVGRHVASGIYFSRLVVGGTAATRKMLLLDGGMIPSGGVPTGGYADETVTSAAAKPAAITCDIVAAKPGYETVVIPGVVVPEGLTEMPEPIVMTPTETSRARLQLEVGAFWEFFDIGTGSYEPQTLETYSCEIIGTREVDGLTYYEFDTWPVFVPGDYHDPEQLPLFWRDTTTDAIYFRHNGENVLLLPPYGDIDLSTLTDLSTIPHFLYASENQIKLMPRGSELTYRYCNLLFDYSTGLYAIEMRTSGENARQVSLRRSISSHRLFGPLPGITPVDGIQKKDIAYLIRLAFELTSASAFRMDITKPVWLMTEGIDDEDLIPEFANLRFHLTTEEEVRGLAEEYETILSPYKLFYEQDADTISVEFTWRSFGYEGAKVYGPGYTETYTFFPQEDTWSWRVLGVCYDYFFKK